MVILTHMHMPPLVEACGRFISRPSMQLLVVKQSLKERYYLPSWSKKSNSSEQCIVLLALGDRNHSLPILALNVRIINAIIFQASKCISLILSFFLFFVCCA